jgi:hypothetical protein
MESTIEIQVGSTLNGNNRVFDGNRACEAYHEIGHFFAFVNAGVKIESVEVGENFGRTRVPPQDVDDALGYVVALCAGKAAVAKWQGYSTPNDKAAWRKSDDHRRAYKAALKVSQGNHKGAGLLLKYAEHMADVFVEAHWHELHEPARLLAERGELKVVKRGR